MPRNIVHVDNRNLFDRPVHDTAKVNQNGNVFRGIAALCHRAPFLSRQPSRERSFPLSALSFA